MNSKKFSLSAFAGILALTMTVALAGSGVTAADQVAYNQVGVTLLGKQKVAAGETYTASNGQKVPSSITYIDAAGGKTNYLSVRQISDLLDAQMAWNGATGNVDFAPIIQGDLKMEDLDTIIRQTPRTPEFGTAWGPFTEVNPATVSGAAAVSTIYDGMKIVSGASVPAMTNYFSAIIGHHIRFTVTNNGEQPISISARRAAAVSTGMTEQFTTIALDPGQTVTRAFSIADGFDDLKCYLSFGVARFGIFGGVDVTVSLAQYA